MFHKSALSLLLLAVIGESFSTLAAAAEPDESIIYTALRPANWELYLLDEPGKPPRRLTEDPALDYNPAVSPDGRWVVFCSERRGTPDLFAIDLTQPGPPRLLIESEAMEDAPAFSPDGQHLVFVCTREGNAEICRAPFAPERTLDASAIINLSENSAGDFQPTFSPDGKQIAFSSDRDSYKASEIYLMRADGSQARRLTESPGWDGSPAWSPDGQAIYFYSERDAKPRIYRMATDGANQEPVTSGEQAALSPALGPDGRLFYTVQQDGKWRIESANSDGSDPRPESDQERDYWSPTYDAKSGRVVCHGSGSQPSDEQFNSSTPGPFLVNDAQRVSLPDRRLRLTAIRGYFPAVNAHTGEIASDEGFDRIVISRLDGSQMREALQPAEARAWRPTWSKDGQWLACSVGLTFAGADQRVRIWKFRPEGGEIVRLTEGSGANNAFPDFSPDGRSIVFRSGRDGNHELYLMNAQGEELRRLTENPATDTMPAFSPDGRRIAFTSNRDGDYELYLLELDENGRAGESRRLTESAGRDTHPKFSPDGRWLVFASERGGMNDETPRIPVFNPQPYGEIFALRIEDGTVVRLTHNTWEDGTPAWAGPQVED